MLFITITGHGVRVEVRVSRESEPPRPIIETTGEEAPATRPACRLAKTSACECGNHLSAADELEAGKCFHCSIEERDQAEYIEWRDEQAEADVIDLDTARRAIVERARSFGVIRELPDGSIVNFGGSR